MLASIIERTSRYLWVFAFAVFLLYVLSLSFAATRGGDFVHLWLGGQSAATRPWGSALYDPATHYQLLTDTSLPLDDYWGERYEQLGVFFYPPVAALFYAPLGRLPLTIAAGAMGLINIALVLATAWGLRQLTEKRVPYALLLLLLLTYPAIFFNYALGQNGIMSLSIVVLSATAVLHGRDKSGGAILSLLLFKPNWLATLAWWPLVQRRWQTILGMIGGGAFLAVLSLLLWGWSPWMAYLQLLPRITRIHEGTSYVLEEQYTLLSLMRRYDLADLWGWVLVLLVFFTAVYLLTRPHIQTTPLRWQLGLVWNTAVLLNPHVFHYDVILSGASLLLPLADWTTLSPRVRASLVTLLITNHLAFPLMQAMQWHNTIPLPLFQTVLVWLWFAVALHQQSATTPHGRKSPPPHPDTTTANLD